MAGLLQFSLWRKTEANRLHMQNVAQLIGASVQMTAVSLHQSIKQKAEMAMDIDPCNHSFSSVQFQNKRNLQLINNFWCHTLWLKLRFGSGDLFRQNNYLISRKQENTRIGINKEPAYNKFPSLQVNIFRNCGTYQKEMACSTKNTISFITVVPFLIS